MDLFQITLLWVSIMVQQELQLFGDSGIITSYWWKEWQYWKKKKKRQTSIYVLLFGLKKGLPIYRISFYKDSSVTQEKINDVIIAGNIN